MPSNLMAWSHLLGGSAFVKMSADCMSVWTYSIEMCSLSSCSAMQARFTLCVRCTQRSLDEKRYEDGSLIVLVDLEMEWSVQDQLP